MDNSSARTTDEESEHPPLTSCSQKGPPLKNSKSGQLICYKTGQVYLLLTAFLLQLFFYSALRVRYSNPCNGWIAL